MYAAIRGLWGHAIHFIAAHRAGAGTVVDGIPECSPSGLSSTGSELPDLPDEIVHSR